MMQRRSIVKRRHQPDAVPVDDEMMVARGHVCRSRLELLSPSRFDDANGAGLVESIGEGPGESGRHVLRDDDRWRFGWQPAQDRLDRLRPTGRCTDGDDAMPSPWRVESSGGWWKRWRG